MRTFFIAFTLGILVGSIVTAYLSAPEAYEELKLAKSQLFGTPIPSEEEPVEPLPPTDQPEPSEAVESLPGTTQAPEATPEAPRADPESLPPSETYPLAAPKSAPDATPAPEGDQAAEPAPATEPHTEGEPERLADPEPKTDPAPPTTPTPTPPGPPPEQPTTPESAPEDEPKKPESQPETNEDDAADKDESLGEKAQRALDTGKQKASEITETTTRKAQELKKEAEPLIDQSVDLAIATAIRAQYKLERRVDADAIDLIVKNRQVTLSGVVPSKEMRQLAIEIAMSTKGVAQVSPQKLEIAP